MQFSVRPIATLEILSVCGNNFAGKTFSAIESILHACTKVTGR